MWYTMARAQQSFQLSERLIRAIMDMRVIGSHNDDVVQLLQLGADVNCHYGMLLPLQCACMVSDVDTLRILLDHGAQINNLDGYGRAALHYAAEKDVDCVSELLHQGAAPNIPDSNRDTPLHWAAFKNNADCVRMLLECGATVDVLDYNNDSPLSWAAQKGNLESLRVLLQYNAKVSIKNLKGHYPVSRTAGFIALGLNGEKDEKCLAILLEAMGQFDIRTSDGELPSPVSQDNKLVELFTSYCCKPRSLQGQCRFRIRQALGQCYLPQVLPKLPIPDRLQSYIMLLTQPHEPSD